MVENRSFLNKINASVLAFFFCCLIIAGLFTTHFARSLSSIGTIGLALSAIISLLKTNTFSNIRKQPWFLGFILIYILHLTGFLYPEVSDPKTMNRDLVMKLPLLILPFSFAVLPALSKVRLQQLYYVFVICVFLGSLYSAGYYFTHFDYVNELYIHSDVMETPTNHVRYSLMVGFAVLIGYKFIREKFFVFRPIEKWFLIGITIWLFIFLHILAVRSGLVAFYAVAGLGLAFDFFFRRRFLSSVLIGFGLMLSLVLAFFTLPTFYNKFFLTIADVKSVSEAESAHDYSIAGRVYSFKVATEVIKDNPIIGVGIGNLEAELEKRYETMFPEILDRGHILPHNQFIYTLAVFGIAGLLIFLICFYFPLFRFARLFEPLYLFHYLIITFSFLFETTLETQVGLVYSILFILLPLWYFRQPETPTLTWKNGSFFS